MGETWGREDAVGMLHLRAYDRNDPPTGRLGRLSLVSCICLLSACHFCFQRHSVVRCMPHLRATTPTGNSSSTSNRNAVALAFGRLGLVE